MNNCLKVLYIDDTQRDLDNYGAIWKELLNGNGFENIDFRYSLKFDFEIVEQQLPHIVIADNVLVTTDGEELDNEGCLFIADLKKRYEHITCILFTQESFSIKTLGQLTPNPDLLIPKTHFRSPNYRRDWIGPKIKKLLMRRPLGNVTFDMPELVPEYEHLNQTIECLLEQCLNDVSAYETGLTAQIKLSRLTGGVSSASVFLVTVSGMKRFQNVPLVFRISNREYMAEEVNNYKRFVSLQVPHDLRVELVGFGEHSDFGGAIYAFALADVENTTTALSLLKENTKEQVITLKGILDRVFSRTNMGWYNNDNNGTTRLVEYFSSREEYNPQKDHRRIRGISKNLQKFGLVTYSIDGDFLTSDKLRVPLPRNIMEKLGELSLQYAVVHGDLNLNNIIVSECDQRIALIDFEYCGIDHLFKDFISLEISALDLIESFDDFDAALEYFRTRHSLDNFWKGDSELIGTIRTVAAIKCLEASSNPEVCYLLCLAFHLFKVAALDDLNHKHFVVMLASLYAALEKLDQL